MLTNEERYEKSQAEITKIIDKAKDRAAFLMQSEDELRFFLKHYKTQFDLNVINALIVSDKNPNYRMLLPMKSWNNLNKQVIKGAKSTRCICSEIYEGDTVVIEKGTFGEFENTAANNKYIRSKLVPMDRKTNTHNLKPYILPLFEYSDVRDKDRNKPPFFAKSYNSEDDMIDKLIKNLPAALERVTGEPNLSITDSLQKIIEEKIDERGYEKILVPMVKIFLYSVYEQKEQESLILVMSKTYTKDEALEVLEKAVTLAQEIVWLISQHCENEPENGTKIISASAPETLLILQLLKQPMDLILDVLENAINNTERISLREEARGLKSKILKNPDVYHRFFDECYSACYEKKGRMYYFQHQA